MSSLLRNAALLPLVATLALAGTLPAQSSDRDKRFFQQIEGRWSGPGEIVAGKYKGTKFICNFDGSTPKGGIGMSLDGGCRAGVFSQDMSAKVERDRSGYRGSFLDGAAGKGLDVVGGTVNNNNAVFAIHRKQLTGAMRAQLSDDNTMNVTISVHVDKELVPVIGVTLKRVDGQSVGSLAN